jgi:hypothetical protein
MNNQSPLCETEILHFLQKRMLNCLFFWYESVYIQHLMTLYILWNWVLLHIIAQKLNVIETFMYYNPRVF